MDKIRVALDPGAIAPTRAHKEDAGLDLYTPVDFALYPGNSEIVDTGVHVEIPEGYVGFLKSKSGLNVNRGIVSEGVIDAGYTGSIVVKLYCHESFTRFHRGDKITQLVLLPVETPEIEIVDSISGGERGENGFGSTGR